MAMQLEMLKVQYHFCILILNNKDALLNLTLKIILISEKKENTERETMFRNP